MSSGRAAADLGMPLSLHVGTDRADPERLPPRLVV